MPCPWDKIIDNFIKQSHLIPLCFSGIPVQWFGEGVITSHCNNIILVKHSLFIDDVIHQTLLSATFIGCSLPKCGNVWSHIPDACTLHYNLQRQPINPNFWINWIFPPSVCCFSRHSESKQPLPDNPLEPNDSLQGYINRLRADHIIWYLQSGCG